MEWISVKDELPKKAGSYIVNSGRWNGVHEALYKDGMWTDERGRVFNEAEPISDFVTHWMPLPEPPTN